MENTLFTKKDSGFVCLNCGKEVLPLGYSSRNHCPYCLCSRHVDVNPGDRASECGAVMDPIEVRTEAKRGFVITHRCRKCGFKRVNGSQKDDDTRLLIQYTNPYNIPQGGKK